MTWLSQRSHGRRWWPTQGEEWATVAASPSFHEAYHALRLLGSGTIGPSDLRSRATRAACPRRC
eukprot:15468395-Alexandrium_andersonii.AAC.1